MKNEFNKLHYLFCIFFGLGFLLVVSGDIIFSELVLGKIFGISSTTILQMKNSTFWLFTVSLLSVILLISYTVLGLKNMPKDVPLEQFADSAYYLGFLFTLVSLIFALHNIDVEENMKWGIIGNVIEKNSIALLTTVAGLFIRVFLVQFQASQDQEREKILQRLFNNLKNLSSEIEKSNNEINGITNIETQIQTVFKGLKHSLNELNQNIKQSAQEAEQTKNTWRSFSVIIKNTKDSMDNCSKELTNSNIRIQSSSTLANTELNNFVQAITTASNSIADYEKFQREVVETQRNLHKSNDEAKQDLDMLRTYMIKSSQLLQESIKQAIELKKSKNDK